MCVCVCAALFPTLGFRHFFSVVSAFELQYSKRYTSLRVVFSTLSIRSQMCQLRLFLFLYAISLYLARSFALFRIASLCMSFGSGRDQLFSILVAFTLQHKAHSHHVGLVNIFVCAFALLFIYIYAIVCGKYFSYKLPDAIHEHTVIFRSLSHITMPYLPHIRTLNYVQN